MKAETESSTAMDTDVTKDADLDITGDILNDSIEPSTPATVEKPSKKVKEKFF